MKVKLSLIGSVTALACYLAGYIDMLNLCFLEYIETTWGVTEYTFAGWDAKWNPSYKIQDPNYLSTGARLYMHGRARFRVHDYNSSITDFEKLIALSSNYLDSRELLANSYYNRAMSVKKPFGNVKGALNDLDNAIRVMPKREFCISRDELKQSVTQQH